MAYKVRFANPQKQYQDHRDEFIKAFDDVLSRGDIVMRGDLQKFEDDLAAFIGVKYAIGVNSGTSAIYLGLRASGVKEGDEVITVAHTFIASISCICLAGANPILVDVREDFNIDPKLIEKALTPKTVAIEPVHLNGRACDMEAILDIAKRKGLLIIEDAAQALGASLKMKDGTERKVGSFGNAGCFSLYWAKILGGWGNNGLLVTNDSEIAKKARLLRYNGEDRETRNFYHHSHNLIMDNLHAALLNVKFKYFQRWLERRKQIAAIYQKGLSDTAEIRSPHFGDARFSDVYTNYVIRAERRDALKKYLEEKGVETLISWAVPMYKQPLMLPNNIFLPETEKICKEALSLPIYPEISDNDIEYTIKCIKEFYGYAP